MKTKTLLFSAAALLAVSNVNAQTDITPERFVFSNQELGEYRIDYFYSGANPVVGWQMAIDQSDNGFFVLAGAAAKLGQSEEVPTSNMGQSIQKLTTIVDLGGEIGKVLCMKGQSSNYENGAENIPGADITRKTNPAIAGLKIFMPRPPKACLTSKTAKNEADTLKYQGKKAGSVKPKIAAVTSADKSVI